MTQIEIDKQIENIRKVTNEAIKSKKSARKFLLDAGIIKRKKRIMKKILLSAFILVSLSALSQGPPQVDTLKLRVGKFTIQARDAEALRYFFQSSDIYDDLVDSLNSKFRKNPKPANQDVLNVDSVAVEALLGLSRFMRQESYEITSPYYNRVDASIKAVNVPLKAAAFLQKRIVEYDTRAQQRQNALRGMGRDRYIGPKKN